MADKTPTALLIAILMAMVAARPALAQTAGEASNAAPYRSNEGVVVYPAAYFEQFNAATALEMVQQLPGFTFQNSDSNTRGYAGAAGNVLINTKRPSGKSNSLEDILRRIPSDNVASVELIQGSVAGYDTGGQSQVANVNMVGTASTTRTFQFTGFLYDDGHFSPGLEAVRSSINAEQSLTISGEYTSDHHAWRGEEVVRDGAGNIVRLRQFEDPWTFEAGIFNVDHERALGSRSSIRSQLRVRGFDFIRPGVFRNFAVGPSGILTPEPTDLSTTKRWAEEYELSTVVERDILASWRAEATLLARSYAFNDSSISTEGQTGAITRSRLKRTDREYLGRMSIERPIRSRDFLEFGIESAANSRDQALKISVLEDNATTLLDLSGSNAKVREARNEAFGNYLRQVTPKLSIEGGLRFEWSTISRTGTDENSRNFSFLKPAMRIRYSPSGTRQLRLNVERQVSQLSFSDFLSNIDFAQGGLLNGGNPTLSPSARWRLDGAVEQRFGAETVISVEGFHEWISDVIYRAPVFGGAFDAPSNIGDGRRYGASIDASTSLNPVGLEDSRLDINASWSHSAVTDPLTGLRRQISGEETYSLAGQFRKNFPSQKLSFNIRAERRSDIETFRLRQIDIRPNITELYGFVETTRFSGLLVRVGVDYILDEEDDRRFITFVRDRSTGIVIEDRLRRKRQGAFLNVVVRGNF